MNFKKNFKRFFTMSRSAEGFTLVELIVVIAILGILVGVGMPAYGSYVEAANLGVDRNNLAIVNNCFAVACIENGVDPATGISGAELTWDGNKVTDLASVALKTRTVTDAADGIKTSFKANLGAGVEFKVHTSSDIAFSDGKFVSTKLGAEGGAGGNGGSGSKVTVNYTLPDGTTVPITIDQADVDAFNGSAFMDTQKGLGVDALLGKLGTVTDFAAAVFGGTEESGALDIIKGDINFLRAFAGYHGIDASKMTTPEEVMLAVSAKYTTTDVDGDGELDYVPPANDNIMASNGLVLYAAQNSSMDKSAITTLLTGDAKQTILNTLNGNGVKQDTGLALAQAAAAYGMFTSYAHSLPDDYVDPDTKQTKADLVAIADNKDNPTGVMNMLDNKGFQSYISGDGQDDIDGYLAAMGMISDSAQNSNVATDVLVNGFANNSDLASLINGALGTTTTPEA